MSSIFTRILRGELPGHFVWKDAVCFALMTVEPIRSGHVLVIPNQEVDHWDDVPVRTASHMMTVSQHIAKAIKRNIPCKRVGLMLVGLDVPHTHIHLVPLDTIADMDSNRARPAPETALAAIGERLRATLLDEGHDAAQV
jgi:diadenosine tetraphosphate (Ap4A) HIT family hydrolase